MIHRHCILTLMLAFASVPSAHAVDPPNNAVYAFLSPYANLEAPKEAPRTQAEWATKWALILGLRPNLEQTAHAFVYNSAKTEQTVHVTLAALLPNPAAENNARPLPAGSEIARTAEPIKLAPGQLARVKLQQPAMSSAVRLPDKTTLVLRVEPILPKDAVAKPVPPADVQDFECTKLDITRPLPSLFTIEPRSSAKGIVEIKVAFKYDAATMPPLLNDRASQVRLDLRPDLNPWLTKELILESALDAELPPGGTATLYVKLDTAKMPKLGADKPKLGISIDGVERAAMITTNFDGDTAEYREPFTNVRLSQEKMVPGQPVLLTVEADAPENMDAPSVSLDVEWVAGRSADTLRLFPSDRETSINVSCSEKAGVVLTPTLRDWTVRIPTAGMLGKRTFKLTRGDASHSRALIVDRTPPRKPEFKNLPEKNTVLPGAEQTLVAVADDPESGITAVYFYTGDTPPSSRGVAAPGSMVVKGEKVAKDEKKKILDNAYQTVTPLKLPEETGETPVGVLFVNGVTLGETQTVLLMVREKEKPKEAVEKEKVAPVVVIPTPTTGTLLVRVLQSTRAQPGLPVTLSDSTGRVLMSSTTDASGSCLFTELQPGDYTVSSVKKADQNARGSTTVQVTAGFQTTNAEVQVKR